MARRAYRPLEEVLEEYALVRADVDSVREAAERMGMSFSALDKALYRARKQGIEGALPPPNQLDRGIANGVALHLVSGRGGQSLRAAAA